MINDIPKVPNMNGSIGGSKVTPPGYRSRVLDEKARKEREDNQRKLVLERRAFELKEMDLRLQEEKQSTLRREIAKLEAQMAEYLKLIQQKNQEVTLAENRIRGIKEEMKMIRDRMLVSQK